MLVWLLDALRFEAILFELFGGLAKELQVHDDIRLELHESVALLVILVLNVALILHFQAHCSDIIIALLRLVLLAAQPAPIEIGHLIEVVDQELEVALVRVEAQLAVGFHFSWCLQSTLDEANLVGLLCHQFAN